MTEPSNDPRIDALLRAERARPPLEPARVDAILSAARARASGGSGGGEPGDGARTARGAAPRSSNGALLPASVLSALAGFAAGVFFQSTLGAPPYDETPTAVEAPAASPRTSATSRPESPEMEAAVGAPAHDDVASPPPVHAESPLRSSRQPRRRTRETSTPPQVVAAQPALADQLAAERRLIDAARVAISSGTPDAALHSLALHRERHERGLLSEERDALEIEALAMNDDWSRAHVAHARFDATYPGSIHAERLRALFSAHR